MKHIITAAAIIAGTGAVASAGQYFLEFQWYTGGEGTSQADLQGFTACIDTDEDNRTVDFTFAFDATGLGSITDFWFEDGMGLDDSVTPTISDSGDGVQYVLDPDPTGTSPAGNPDGWTNHFTFASFDPAGNVHDGLSANEWVTFTFGATDDFFSTGLGAVLRGEVNIAFHLQSIGAGGNDSAHFISVPLPTAGMLACTGLALTAGGRRRR